MPTPDQAQAQAPWTPEERARFNLIRVKEGWTYDHMAALIGFNHGSTLYTILEKGTMPRKTTIYQLRSWLSTYRPTQKASA